MAHLPAHYREVLELSRVQGMRYGQITETLGISVKTVEAQLGRRCASSRARLAKWLPEAGDL